MFDNIFGKGDDSDLKMEITSLVANKLKSEEFNGFTKWYKLKPEEFSSVLFFMTRYWNIFFRGHFKVSEEVLPDAVVDFLHETDVINNEKSWASLQEMKSAAKVYNACRKHGAGWFERKQPEKPVAETVQNQRSVPPAIIPQRSEAPKAPALNVGAQHA